MIGARHIVYSLLYHSSTKSTSPIPVVVLTTTAVIEAKRKRLEADGATVILSDSVPLPAWIKPGSER
jgi:hypothetical protein